MSDVVVIGAGVAGLASAIALRRVGHSVTVVDPAAPGALAGRPQGHHAHAYGHTFELLARWVHDLPERLDQAGAVRNGAHRALSADGATTATAAWPWSCSRPLLDGVLRDAAVDAGVRLRAARARDVELTPDGATVMGLDGGPICAGVLIDASGTAAWLAPRLAAATGDELACDEVASRERYVSARLHGMPPLPFQTLSARCAGADVLAQRVEGGGWLVSLQVGEGGPLATDGDAFREQVHRLTNGELPALEAEVGRVHRYGPAVSRLYLVDELPAWPAPAVVVGDSLCHTTPRLGFGISAALRMVAAFDEHLPADAAGDARACWNAQAAVLEVAVAFWDEMMFRQALVGP